MSGPNAEDNRELQRMAQDDGLLEDEDDADEDPVAQKRPLPYQTFSKLEKHGV